MLFTSVASLAGLGIGGLVGGWGLGPVGGSYLGAALVASRLRDNTAGAFVGSVVGMVGGLAGAALTASVVSDLSVLGYGAVHGLITVGLAGVEPSEPDAPPLSRQP